MNIFDFDEELFDEVVSNYKNIPNLSYDGETLEFLINYIKKLKQQLKTCQDMHVIS